MRRAGRPREDAGVVTRIVEHGTSEDRIRREGDMIAVLIGGGHREREVDALGHLLSQRSAQYRRVVLRSISRYRDHRARGTRATGVSVGPAERRRVRTTLAGNRAPGEGPSVIRVIHEARSGRLAAEEEIDMISVGIGRAHTEGQGGTNRDRLAR